MASRDQHGQSYGIPAGQNTDYQPDQYASHFPSQQASWRQGYQQPAYNALPNLAHATGTTTYSGHEFNMAAGSVDASLRANAASPQVSNAPSTHPSGQNANSGSYSQFRPSTQSPAPSYLQPMYEPRSSYAASMHSSQNHSGRPTTFSNAPYVHNERQQAAPSDSSSSFVDPYKVYDFRAEQQRKSQLEVERQRQLRAADTARRSEEQRKLEQERADLAKHELAREQADLQRQRAEKERADRDRVEQERLEKERQRIAQHRAQSERRGEDDVAEPSAPADVPEKQRRHRKATQASQKLTEEHNPSGSAASALQMLSSADMESSALRAVFSSSRNDEEVEMRAMFKKMREFNARNPSMLAKLWEEERTAHVAQSSTSTTASIQPQSPQQLQKSLASQDPPAEHSLQPSTSNSRPQSKSRADQSRPTSQTQNKQQKQQKIPGHGSSTSDANAGAAGAPKYSRALAPAIPSIAVAGVARSTAPLQPSTMQSSAPPAPQSSIWPTHKKGSFVEAAQRYLAEQGPSRKTSQHLTKAMISKMLDTNPSYVHFCEQIESHGLRFDRSAFARELLRAIPDMLKTQSSAKLANAANVNTAAPMQAAERSDARSTIVPAQIATRPAEAPVAALISADDHISPNVVRATSGTDDYSRPQTLATPATRPPDPPVQYLSGGNHQFPQLSAQQDHVALSITSPDVTHAEAQPLSPNHAPADKEEAARKRTFNDLVDLAADESDDDEPPQKLAKVPQMPIKTFQPPMGDYSIRPLNTPTPFNAFFKSSAQHNGPYKPPQASPNIMQVPAAMAPITPMPMTSVLPGSIKPSGPSPEQQQAERMKGKMLVEPLMRDRVSRKSKYSSTTIAQDVLLATGRHPNMRALNSHLMRMQKLLSEHGGMVDHGGGNKSDLSTIRWAIIDPGQPIRFVGGVKEHDAIETSDVVASTEFDEVSAAVGGRGRRADATEQPKKRRGRPPLRSHDANTRTPDSSQRANNAAKATPGMANVPNSMESLSANPATGGGVGYAAFPAQFDESGKRKRGRPKGWRKDVHSREANGFTPVPKPPKKSDATVARPRDAVEKPLQEAQYQPYRCKWHGCEAELHNLDALALHVKRIHKAQNASGRLECHWQECRSFGTCNDEGTITPTPGSVATFAKGDAWDHHVDAVHIRPIAWQLGDGPRSGMLVFANDSDTYLSDARGRSVTPVISAEVKGLESAEEVNYNIPVRKLGRPPKDGIGKDRREASTELMKLRHAKQVCGYSLGPEGSQLANAKRRAGFLDDEDFYDIIESDGSQVCG